MRFRHSKRLPRTVYDALPYLYGCMGVGLLYGAGSGIPFVIGIALLIAAVLVIYMRGRAREQAYQQMIQRKQKQWEQRY